MGKYSDGGEQEVHLPWPDGRLPDLGCELGFVGAAVKAAGGVVKGVKAISKVFKKKKAKKKAAKKGKVMTFDTQEIVGQVPRSDTLAATDIIKQAAMGATDNADLVRSIVAAVPGPVRDVVLEALKAQSQNLAVKEQTMNSLAGQIDESLKPQIIAMLSTLQAQKLSQQATYEHDSLVAKARFEDGTLNGLQNLSDRLDGIEKRLNKSAIVGPTKVNIFGGRNVLES